MTIVISPGIASQFAAAGTENNPIIVWDNQAADGVWSVQNGTIVESQQFLNTPSTFDRFIVVSNLSGNVRVDVLLPEPRTFNCMCFGAHTMASVGGALRPQTSVDGGSTWQNVTAAALTVTTNDAICFLFDGAPTTDRWRIRLINGAASTQMSIGVAFLGTFLQIPQRIYQGYTPPITPTVVDMRSNVSETGNLLGSKFFRKGSTTVANMTHLLPSFIRDTGTNGWANFQRHFNRQGGAFWLWRPTQFQDAFYGWRDGDTIMPTNSGPKSYMAASMGMRLFDAP